MTPPSTRRRPTLPTPPDFMTIPPDALQQVRGGQPLSMPERMDIVRDELTFLERRYIELEQHALSASTAQANVAIAQMQAIRTEHTAKAAALRQLVEAAIQGST